MAFGHKMRKFIEIHERKKKHYEVYNPQIQKFHSVTYELLNLSTLSFSADALMVPPNTAPKMPKIGSSKKRRPPIAAPAKEAFPISANTSRFEYLFMLPLGQVRLKV